MTVLRHTGISVTDDLHQNIKETREWEEKIAERVCRVISAIAQSKARFGAVEIIEKDVETFLQSVFIFLILRCVLRIFFYAGFSGKSPSSLASALDKLNFDV